MINYFDIRHIFCEKIKYFKLLFILWLITEIFLDDHDVLYVISYRSILH